MRADKCTLLFFLLLLPLITAFAQHKSKSNYSRSRYNHNATKVKGSKAKIVCPIFKESKFPYHGIGLKLGDPFALTYKLFASKKFSIAVDVGKAASGLYANQYRAMFNNHSTQDTLTTGSSIVYVAHRVKSDWVEEIKFLYSIDASVLSAGLQFYLGIGALAKQARLEYTYQYNAMEIGKFSRSYTTLGQTTVVGIEYNYFQLPISAFMELELLTDILRNPGSTRFQGGVGLRYVFR